MKILHVYGWREGGAGVFFSRLANGLGRRGVEQKALTQQDPVWAEGVDESLCPLERKLTPEGGYWADVKWARRVRYAAKSFDPDVILSWPPGKTARLLPKGRHLNVARLGAYHDVAHYGKCDMLICNTPNLVRHVEKGGWSSERVSLISNFIELREHVPALARDDLLNESAPRDAWILLAMGRMHSEKGFDVLLRALKKLPQSAHLVILGDGPHREAIHLLAGELDLVDRVIFPGWVSDPMPWIAAADIFVCPSRHEPLGQVVMEGWSRAKPVVATNTEGPSWLIEHGVDGLLARNENDDDLAAQISTLMYNPDMAVQLANAGRDKLYRSFSEEAICGAYLQALQSKLEARRMQAAN